MTRLLCKCDRCGVLKEQKKLFDLPKKWIKITFAKSKMEYHLCKHCANDYSRALLKFIKELGLEE